MCTAHVRIVTEGYLGFPQWLWFSNCLQTSNSINHKCCIKTCEYFILTIKENCQTDNYGKFWKKICSCRIMVLFHWYLSIWTRQIMPGGGDFVSFFPTRGPEFCTEKLSPGRGFWRKKLVARQSARGGMVTSQIDTCITTNGHFTHITVYLVLLTF